MYDDDESGHMDSEDLKKWGHKDVEHWRAVSNVHYYAREGYYGTAILVCDGRLATIQDVSLAVLKGVCLTLLGKIPEAIRQLEGFSKDNEFSLGALHALKWAHLSAFNPDNKSIVEIETEISTCARNEKTPYTSFASAAEVLYFAGEFQKAKQMLDIARKRAAEKHAKHYCLMGWIDLAMGKKQKSTQELFEKAGGQEFPDGNIGRCRILEGHHSAQEMRVAANELTMSTINFLPGHIEKAKAMIMLKDWYGVMDCIVHADQPEGSNPCMEVIRTVHGICFAGEASQLKRTLQLLLKSLDENETTNHVLYAKISQLIVSISGKNENILNYARDFLSRALRISRKPDYVALSIRIAFGLRDSKGVSTLSTEVLTMDCEDPFALLSSVISMLMISRVSDARAQFDILPSAHPKLMESPLYFLIASVLAKHSKDKTFENFRQHIENLVEMLRNQLQSHPFGLNYLGLFSSDLLYSAVEQCFDFYPLVPIKAPDECLKLTAKILQMITDVAPGLAHCSLQMAHNNYLCSNTSGAEKWSDKALEKDDSLADAYLLRAQLVFDRGGQVDDAKKALESGLSFNLQLGKTSLYKLIDAKMSKKRNENDNAIRKLKEALKTEKEEPSNNLFQPKEPTDKHKITVQLELIDTLQNTKRVQEAEQAMVDAMAEWAGKPEADQLVIAQAQLYLTKGHVERALNILKKIEPGQSNFHLSRIKMADIYLEEKKDKRMYAACHRELLKVEATPASYSIVGDAFMRVQEPEEAISFFEQALKMQSKDVQLAEKIGEAYVMAHLYSKAVNFYESSMNIYKDKNMRLKLAHLLLKLKNYEKCEKVLKQAIEKTTDSGDLAANQTQIQFLLLLAECHEQTSQFDAALKDFEKARAIHSRSNDKSNQGNHKKEGARICYLQAELLHRRKQNAEALEACRDAILLHEQDLNTNLLLCKIYKEEGKFSLLQQPCTNVLMADPNNDEAHTILADLYFARNESGKAIASYTALLNANPHHWHAMSRVVEICCRTDDIGIPESYLNRARELDPRCFKASGFNYCQGRFEYFTGDASKAIEHFMRTKSHEWLLNAMCNTIDICLNDDLSSATESDQAEIIDIAQQCLARISNFKGDLRYQLAENFILLHSKNKDDVKAAIAAFDAIPPLTNVTMTNSISASREHKHVGAAYGMAKGYVMLKEIGKAKAILKELHGRAWSLDEADYLEKCWLLMADIYIGDNKRDRIKMYLEPCLKHNVNSIKGFELMGKWREKENKMEEAANYYDKAFKATKETNLHYGFRLADAQLKCKKLFACIETCNKVLKIDPQYPKIREEIMNKARNSIRT